MKRPLLTSVPVYSLLSMLFIGLLSISSTNLQAQDPPLIDGLPGFQCACDADLPPGFMELTIDFTGDENREWFISNCSGAFTLANPLIPIDTTQIIETPPGSGRYSITLNIRAEGDACVFLHYRAPGGEIIDYATLPQMNFNAESCMMQQVEILAPVNEFCRAADTYTFSAMHDAAFHEYFYDWFVKDAVGDTILSNMSNFPVSGSPADFNGTYDFNLNVDPGTYFLCVEGRRADEPSCYVMNSTPISITNGSDDISISGDARFCINGTNDVHEYTLDGSSFGATGVSWQVKQGSIPVTAAMPGGGTMMVDFGTLPPGDYTLCASGTDSDGCIVSSDFAVEIFDPSSPAIVGPTEAVCGMSATYTLDYDETLVNVAWTSTGGTTPVFDAANPSTATVTWDNSSNPTSISVTGETETGCPVSITQTINLSTSPGSLFGIDGLSSVCPNELAQYCIDVPNADDLPYNYSWSLADAAGNGIPLTLLSTNSGTCQSINFAGFIPGNQYLLTLTASPALGSACASFSVSKAILVQDDTPPAMACISSGLNVSIGNNCQLVVTADLLVEGIANIENDAFVVELRNLTTGEAISGNILTFDHLGDVIEVKVIHKCSGQSCWGTITVEDKSVPPPICPIGTGITSCADMSIMDEPLFFPSFPVDVVITSLGNKRWLIENFDNCGDVTLTYVDTVIAEACGDGPFPSGLQNNQSIVNRRWIVEDENGGASFCDVEVLVQFEGGTKVDLPPNFDGIIPGSEPALAVCGDWPQDENGNPHPSFSGMPTGVSCANIEVLGYTDRHIYICNSGPARKIIREWSVWDSCENEDFLIQQFITLIDDQAPICAALDEFQVVADQHSCTQDVVVPYPAVAGECDGSVLTIEMGYKLRDEVGLIPSTFTYDGVDNDTDNQFFTIPDLHLDSDTIWINFIVTDACGNTTANTGCFTEIEIIDDSPPNPVCDLNNNISLGPDGCGFAGPGTFDDNSFDNCGVFQVVLNRMDNYETCHSIGDNEQDSTTHCPKPNFDFLEFLGVYEGHYYYLSQDPAAGPRAFGYAEAIDAYVADIDSTQENTWINTQVRNYTDDPYLIGYRTMGLTSNNINPGNNDFNAQAGGTIDYNNWAADEPDWQTDGHGELYVAVHGDGEWRADRQTDINTFYVIEIENPCTFRQQLKFCCEDVHNETMVMVRVIDHFGNYADCMVNVEVQDFFDPVVANIDSLTSVIDLDCDALEGTDFEAGTESMFLDTISTTPIFEDNCLLHVDYEVDISGEGECGAMRITRRWTATDYSDNTASYSQVIKVGGESSFTEDNIIWPNDHDTDSCFGGIEPEDLPDSLAYPVFIGANNCSVPAATKTDQVFQNVEGACLKVLRKWTVIDWCQDGRQWTYTQVIKVFDNEGPVFNDCSDVLVTEGTTLEGCVFETWESGLQANVSDNCQNPSQIIVRFDLDYHCDGVYEFENIADDNANGVHPFGTHCITWYAEDACGNSSTCSKEFTIEGEAGPTPYCLSEVVTVIPPSPTGSGSGTAGIWASDFDLGSFDGCSPGTLTFTFSEDPDDTFREFTCADIPNGIVDTIPLQMWVTDSEGNSAYCPVSLILQDNQDLCLDATGSSREWAYIGGNVMTESLNMLDQTEVSLRAGNNTMDNDVTNMGEYSFSEVPMYDDYQLKATRDDNPLNGVSTLDLVLIQRHILGAEDLDSPYKLIAADANKSESVTAADILEIRKLILGIYDEYPNSDSWTFVDRNFQFTDPQMPWPYENDIQLFQVANDLLALDFIGVKVGDVNESVIVSLVDDNIGSRSTGVLRMNTEIRKEGNLQYIDIIADEALDLEGLQMSLQLDYGSTAVQGLEAGALAMSANNYVLSNNGKEMMISWNSTNISSVDQGAVLFTIVANASNGSELVELSTTAQLADEAYVHNGDSIEILDIEFGNESMTELAGFVVYQNNPNPFKDRTTIGFETPEAGNVLLQVMDAAGKVVFTASQTATEGYNEFSLSTNEFQNAGLLYYQISTNGHIATRKMIVVK